MSSERPHVPGQFPAVRHLRRLPHLDTCVLVRPTTPNIYQTVDKDSESACEIALKKAGAVKTLDPLNERTSMVADEAKL